MEEKLSPKSYLPIKLTYATIKYLWPNQSPNGTNQPPPFETLPLSIASTKMPDFHNPNVTIKMLKPSISPPLSTKEQAHSALEKESASLRSFPQEFLPQPNFVLSTMLILIATKGPTQPSVSEKGKPLEFPGKSMKQQELLIEVQFIPASRSKPTLVQITTL